MLIRDCAQSTFNSTTATDTMLYGYYMFNIAKSENITANILTSDIANYSENYSEAVYQTTLITISPSHIFYPVFRINVSDTAVIYDTLGNNITSMFTTYTNTLYKFYVLEQVVSPSTINYTIAI
jgi:hypothetical protein